MQLRLRRYVPAVHLAVVVVISVFGTLITDNVTDGYNIPLSTSTPIFADVVAVVFGVWYPYAWSLLVRAHSGASPGSWVFSTRRGVRRGSSAGSGPIRGTSIRTA